MAKCVTVKNAYMAMFRCAKICIGHDNDDRMTNEEYASVKRLMEYATNLYMATVAMGEQTEVALDYAIRMMGTEAIQNGEKYAKCKCRPKH